jgi:hypothetical protein
MTNFLASKWSAIVELAAQDTSIIASVANGKYQADAAGAKVIHVGSLGAPTVGNYVKGTPMTYTALTDTDTPITMDVQKYFAIPVEDIDVAQSQADFKSGAVAEAGQALGLEADKFIFGLYGDAGLQINDKEAIPGALDVNNVNIDDVFLQAKVALDEASAGPDRFAAISPRIHAKLLKAGYVRDTQLGDGIYQNGYVGKVFGFEVYVTNELTVNATTGDHCIFATKRAMPFAASVSKVETLRLQDQFGDGVRGLYVFGGAVLFADEVVDAWLVPIANA